MTKKEKWLRDALIVRSILVGGAAIILFTLFIVIVLAIEAPPLPVRTPGTELDAMTSIVALMLMFPGFTVMCFLPSLGIVGWFGSMLLKKEIK